MNRYLLSEALIAFRDLSPITKHDHAVWINRRVGDGVRHALECLTRTKPKEKTNGGDLLQTDGAQHHP